MPSSGHQTLSGLLMVTPATLTGSALTRAPGALGRVFVGAQPEECGLTEHSVGGPFGVHDLADELRPHPRCVTHARRRIEGRGIHPPALELRRKRHERLLREAGADFAHIAQPWSVVQPDEQRTEVLAAAFRRGVSADDELRFLPYLHLAPVARADAGVIEGALVLRDDPFPAQTLRLAIGGLPVPHETPGHEERIAPLSDHSLECCAALAQRPCHQGSAILRQQIENRVARRRCPSQTATLKKLKARDALLV